VNIKVERSGGFGGMIVTNQVDADTLPQPFEKTVKQILDKNINTSSLKSAPKGASDYYCYTITIDDGTKKHVLEYNEYNIDKDLKKLVSYIEKKSSQK
jgi:Emfourin